MQNKAPQGKADPIPTPEQELERYGVWVKAEPQDIIDDSSIDRETIDGSDAVLLSEEEEVVLDSFDLPEEASDTNGSFDDSLSELDAEQDFEELDALSPLDDQDALAMPSADDESFDFEALEALEDADEPVVSEEAEAPSLDLDDDVVEDSIIDVELDELEYVEPVIASEPAATEKPAASDEGFATTEINIEDFGFSVEESSPGIPVLDELDSMDDTASSGVMEAVPSGVGGEDFESLDIDLEFDDTIPAAETIDSSDDFGSLSGGLDSSTEFETVDIDSIGVDEPSGLPEAAGASAPAPAAAEEFSMEEDISLDSFIDDDDSDSYGVIPDLEIENVSISDEPIGFDDVKAVSDELGSVASGPSSDLLQKIALELASIKDELVSLRGQLSSLKASESAKAESEGPEADGEIAEEAVGGFFDDEDDDTIALTGDELDNILNTADFTEEAAEDEFLGEPESPELDIADDIALLPEDGEYSLSEEPGIETIELPTVEPTDEEMEAISSAEAVTPITSLPDDTSFLDEADDGAELEGMPLDDVPLVEPDPTDLDIIIDSAFGSEDDDEELPVIEAASDEPEPEIVLDIDADDQPVVSTVDAFPETIDELEDIQDLDDFTEPETLGGLDLHSEEPVALEDFQEIEEIGEIEELAEPLADEASAPTSEVEYHPDEIATSLDDSLFVEPIPSEGAEEASELETSYLESEEDAIEPVAESEAESEAEPEPSAPSPGMSAVASDGTVPDKLQRDVKSVLLYLDQLLASLPEEKIEEFASSEYYDTYKRLFDDLGLL
ncbi:MAG: hypothetical protein KKA67_13630 [Spirochaetes bacterium]|nr:hypothetical protein [Spirochaetota bacterium]MBU1079301.1 hypothetical protein [Spirochaetota bacterium]